VVFRGLERTNSISGAAYPAVKLLELYDHTARALKSVDSRSASADQPRLKRPGTRVHSAWDRCKCAH